MYLDKKSRSKGRFWSWIPRVLPLLLDFVIILIILILLLPNKKGPGGLAHNTRKVLSPISPLFVLPEPVIHGFISPLSYYMFVNSWRYLLPGTCASFLFFFFHVELNPLLSCLCIYLYLFLRLLTCLGMERIWIRFRFYAKLVHLIWLYPLCCGNPKVIIIIIVVVVLLLLLLFL